MYNIRRFVIDKKQKKVNINELFIVLNNYNAYFVNYYQNIICKLFLKTY